LGEREEMTKRHKVEDPEAIGAQYTAPHPWFLPNDEIFKGMFDLSPPYPAIQTVSPWCSWIGTEKREDTRVSQW